MPLHEYKVVAAPRRGVKARGVRAPEARFALAVEAEMNRMAAEGWEFVRSDTLPHEERQGWLGGKAVVSRSMLVFRRALADGSEAATHAHAAPRPTAPVYAPPVRAAHPPVPDEPPLVAPALPPVLSPPPAAMPQAAPPVAPPPARDAAPAPAAVLASPRRVPVPPLRPRDGIDGIDGIDGGQAAGQAAGPRP